MLEVDDRGGGGGWWVTRDEWRRNKAQYTLASILAQYTWPINLASILANILAQYTLPIYLANILAQCIWIRFASKKSGLLGLWSLMIGEQAIH